MSETMIGANEAHLLNPHNYETALKLCRAAFTFSILVAVMYFVAIQYLLVKARSSKSKIRPTTTEINLSLTALWTFHQLLDLLQSLSLNIIVQVFWGRDLALEYQTIRNGAAVGPDNWVLIPSIWPKTWRDSLTLIFLEVMMSWFISTSIIQSIAMVNQSMETTQSPDKAFARFRGRCFELINFLGTMLQEGASPTIQSRSTDVRNETKNICRDDKNFGENIELRRHQDESPKDGQRTLNWDIKVDPNALREMMETLGPPGGFGELGFNISKDRVSFGAMGVGTRFNLTFVLEAEKAVDRKKSPKRRETPKSKSSSSSI